MASTEFFSFDAQRVTQELMRRSDMRLTNKKYTDASQLPTAEALECLPRFEKVSVAW